MKFLDLIGLKLLIDKIKDGTLIAGKAVADGNGDNIHTALGNKVDKVTSTDNAIVRFDGTAGKVQNSTAKVDDSGNITATKFVTSGGTASQLVTGTGALTSVDTLAPYEANLRWGGKNLSSSYSPIDAAMIGVLGADRFAFLPSYCITVEYTRDGGETWLDYEATDVQKAQLVSTNTSFIIGKGEPGKEKTIDYMLRITINAGSVLYSTLNKFAILCSTKGSEGCYCTIRTRSKANIDAGIDNWTIKAEKASIGGWSGWNIINTSNITCGGTYEREIQFIFGCTSFTSQQYSGLTILNIKAFGGVGWVVPSNMARYGHLYKYDDAQNATFPANVTATKLIKSGGTTSQILKANGDVEADSNYVKLTGAQTISGVKTFSGGITLQTSTSWGNSDRSIPFSNDGAPLNIRYVFTDANKGLTYNPYTGAVKAGSFVKRGGTNEQFLMADGSVLEKEALPTNVPSDPYGMVQWLEPYLPTPEPYITPTPYPTPEPYDQAQALMPYLCTIEPMAELVKLYPYVQALIALVNTTTPVPGRSLNSASNEEEVSETSSLNDVLDQYLGEDK